MSGKVGKLGTQRSTPPKPAGRPAVPSDKPSSSTRNKPPTGRINQKYKQREFQQQKGITQNQGARPPIRPDEIGYETTNKGRQQQLFERLVEQYGPNFAETDVRLYLKKRQLNEERRKPKRRGGFPLDDSFDKQETFGKLSQNFQQVVLQERSDALAAALPQLPAEAAWRVYTHVPGLLTLMTLEVAHKIKAMTRATGLHPEQVVNRLCAFPRLAVLHPGNVESRLGLLAKVARLNQQQAVQLLREYPQLWLVNSRLLAPRSEELALTLQCCSITSLKLLATHPPLLTAQLAVIQHQYERVCNILGCSSTPAEVVPLLLWHPMLLLPPRMQQQQQQQQQSGNYRPGNAHIDSKHVDGQEDGLPAVFDHQLASVHTAEQVCVQLQLLQEQLQLPLNCVQHMVLKAPQLLCIPQAHDAQHSTAAAALDQLADSWLCADGAAGKREQYQQLLLQQLALKSASRRQTKHHRQQQQQQEGSSLKQQHCQIQWLPPGVDRYVAGDGAAYTAVSCQWWANMGLLQQLSQLTALQQLVLQAPGVLALAAGAAATPAVPPDAQASATTTLEHMGVGRWSEQLQSLCQHLTKLLQAGSGQQQHQKVEASNSLGASLQQSGSAAVAAEIAVGGLLQQVQAAVVLEPNLLAQPQSFVVAQLSSLSRVLLLQPGQLWGVVRLCPAVLWLTRNQLFERVRVLCGILGLPASELRQMLMNPVALPVLLLDVEQLRESSAAVVSVAQNCGRSESDVRLLMRERPELLLAGNMQTVKQLLRSSQSTSS